MSTAVVRGSTGAALPGYAVGQNRDLNQDTDGNLLVNVVAGGGGGGGPVTAVAGAFVDGALVTMGTKADAAYAGTGSASEIAALKGIYAALVAALPAGSNNIGTITLANGGTISITGTPSVQGTVTANGSISQSATTAGETGLLAMGAVTTSSPTYTNAQTNPISLTTTGAVRTAIFGATGLAMDGNAAPAAASSRALQVSAVFNSTPVTLTNGQSAAVAATTTGQVSVDTENQKSSYAASQSFTPAATPTDVANLTGSSTKTLRLRRIVITSEATTSGTMTLQIVKRSTANTTAATGMTAVPLDSANAAASGAAGYYTSNSATLGTAVGNVETRTIVFPTATLGTPNAIVLDYGAALGTQAITLRGTTQQLAVNLAGGTLPTGASLAVGFLWTEE